MSGAVIAAFRGLVSGAAFRGLVSGAAFRGLVSGALAMLALASASRVTAQEPSAAAIDGPRVALEIEACEGVDPDVVRRILEVELGPDAELDALPDAQASRVHTRCEESRLLLVLDEPLTGTHLERSIDLSASLAGSRSRLVALAIAELLAASWIDLGMRHDPEVVVIGAGGAEETRAIALDIARARLPAASEDDEGAPAPIPEEQGPPALGVRAIGVVRVSGEPLHFSIGGGLAADLEVLAPVVIAIDLRAEQGSVGAGDAGDVRLTVAWATALIGLRLPLGRSHADFAIGARAGLGLLEGQPMRGFGAAQVSGPVAGVVGATHVSLHIAYAAYLHVGIELAWITLPVYGTVGAMGPPVARIDGAQMALTLGFEVRPE